MQEGAGQGIDLFKMLSMYMTDELCTLLKWECFCKMRGFQVTAGHYL